MVSRKSRKGKKAWRKNIPDEEEVEGLKKANERAEVTELVDAELFQLDTSRDDKTADAVICGAAKASATKLPDKKYSQLKAEKESQKAAWLEAVKKKEKRVERSALRKVLRKKAAKQKPKTGPKFSDPWAEEPPPSNDDGGWHMPKSLDDLEPGSRHRKRRARALQSASFKKTALAVDKPGCSYNPDAVQHQASLGEAVAVEEVKEAANKSKVAAILDGVMLDKDEPDMSMVDVEDAEEEEEEEEEEEAAQNSAPVRKPTTTDTRKTRADRNRELRVKKLEEELVSRRKNVRMLKQINNVKAIMKEIDGKEKLAAEAQTRRQIRRLLRSKTLPPKLGKFKYKAPPIPVLCTDELNGSLRRLKPSAMLCRDLSKGYERIGAVEPAAPRKHLAGQRARKVKLVSVGQNAERMVQFAEEFQALNTSVKNLEKRLQEEKKKSSV